MKRYTLVAHEGKTFGKFFYVAGFFLPLIGLVLACLIEKTYLVTFGFLWVISVLINSDIIEVE